MHFAVVAKGPMCSDETLFALYARLQQMDVGSGQYETIQDDKEVCIYDVEVSPAYLVNNGAKVGKRSFLPNLRMEMPEADSFLAWFVAQAPIAAGTHLWGAYGVYSLHHQLIRKAVKLSQSRSPKVNSKRAAVKAQMQHARMVKRLKRSVE